MSLDNKVNSTEIENKSPEEISNLLEYKDFAQNNPHHFGTLSEHTQAVLDALPADTSDALRYAALMHDIGKHETVSINPKTGYMQFIGHAAKSVEIMEKNGLFPDDEQTAQYIRDLITLHDTKYSKQDKCQNMLDSHPNGFAKDLITLQYADVMGQSEYNRESKLLEVQKFAQFIEKTGTPEQAEGLSEIIDIIDTQIYRAHEMAMEDEIKANTPVKVMIKEAQEAKGDNLIKYTAFSQLPVEGNLMPTYEKNGIEITTYGSEVVGITIDGKNIEDMFEIPEPSGPDDELIYRLSFEERQYVLDEINRREGRTQEPAEAIYEERLPEKKVFLARSASNQDIFISQSAYDHMKAHPDVNMAHIVEAIGKINDYNGQFRIGEVEMDRVVGKDRCVEVKAQNRDDVEMRARKGRKDESVPCLIEDENHQPEDTTKIVVGICNDRDDGVNTLFTAFYGQLAPKHLCDPSLSPEDRPMAEEFWSTHALVVTEDMLEDVQTKKNEELDAKVSYELQNMKELPGNFAEITTDGTLNLLDKEDSLVIGKDSILLYQDDNDVQMLKRPNSLSKDQITTCTNFIEYAKNYTVGELKNQQNDTESPEEAISETINETSRTKRRR